jgi:hypothetical protein
MSIKATASEARIAELEMNLRDLIDLAETIHDAARQYLLVMTGEEVPVKHPTIERARECLQDARFSHRQEGDK